MIDLKYRFIIATNQVDSLKISEIENVFEYNRHEDTIQIIRKHIEYHKLALELHSPNMEKARLKEEEIK